MADFYATFSILPQYRLHAVVTEGMPNIPGNYSPVSGALYVEKLSGGGFSTGNSGNDGLLVGDISFTANGWAPYNFASLPTKLIGSGSGNVAHNTDGTKTAGGSFAANDNAGGNMGSASGAWALGLTPIPRGAVDRYDAPTTSRKQQLLERYDAATSSYKLQVLERYTGSAWVRET